MPAQFDLLPAVSSDGRHVAFVRDTGVLASSLWIVDVESGAEPRKVAIPGFEEVGITGVQWTPSGREVIFAADVTNLGMLWRTVPFSGQSPPVWKASLFRSRGTRSRFPTTADDSCTNRVCWR